VKKSNVTLSGVIALSTTGVCIGLNPDSANAADLEQAIVNVSDEGEVNTDILPPTTDLDESQDAILETFNKDYYPVSVSSVTPKDYKEIIEPVEAQKAEQDTLEREKAELEKNTSYSVSELDSLKDEGENFQEEDLEKNYPPQPVIVNTPPTSSPKTQLEKDLWTEPVGIPITAEKNTNDEVVSSEIIDNNTNNSQNNETVKHPSLEMQNLEKKYQTTIAKTNETLEKVNGLLDSTKKPQFSTTSFPRKTIKKLEKLKKVKVAKIPKVTKGLTEIRKKKNFVYLLAAKTGNRWTHHQGQLLDETTITSRICGEFNSGNLDLKSEYGYLSLRKSCYYNAKRIERTIEFRKNLQNSELNWGKFYQENPDLAPKYL
jgi:hypothetical protein